MIKKNCKHKNLKVVVKFFEDWIPDKKYDTILYLHVIQHIPTNLWKVHLEKIKEYLRGFAIIFYSKGTKFFRRSTYFVLNVEDKVIEISEEPFNKSCYFGVEYFSQLPIYIQNKRAGDVNKGYWVKDC